MLLQKLFNPVVSPLNPIYNTTPYKAKNLLIFGPEYPCSLKGLHCRFYFFAKKEVYLGNRSYEEI